jgi:hypothetical protein
VFPPKSPAVESAVALQEDALLMLLVGIHQLRTMMTWLKGFNIEYDVTLKKA